MNITNDMHEAFSRLGVLNKEAPGPFTTIILTEAIEAFLKRAYTENHDAEYDVEAVVFFGGIGGATLWPVGDFMNSDNAKDAMMHQTREITRLFPGITMVALVSPTWMITRMPNDAHPELPPAKHPNKKEAVTVALETRDGEADYIIFDVLRLDTGNHVIKQQRDEKPISNGGRMSNFFNRKE